MPFLKNAKQFSKVDKLETPKKFLSILLKTPQILQEMMEEIPLHEQKIRRLKNTWSIEEWCWHLIDSQKIFKKRFESIATGSNPLIEMHQPNFKEPFPLPPNIEISKSLNDFRNVRLTQIEWLEHQDQEFWNLPVRHEEYEPFSAGILLRHMMLVDHVHLFQIEKLWLTKEEYLYPDN